MVHLFGYFIIANGTYHKEGQQLANEDLENHEFINSFLPDMNVAISSTNTQIVRNSAKERKLARYQKRYEMGSSLSEEEEGEDEVQLGS